jgi:hypothetical protein
MTEWREESRAILKLDKITDTDEESNPSGRCALQVSTKQMPVSTNTPDTFSYFSPALRQNFFSFDKELIFQNYCQTVKPSVEAHNWIENYSRVLSFCQ